MLDKSMIEKNASIYAPLTPKRPYRSNAQHNGNQATHIGDTRHEFGHGLWKRFYSTMHHPYHAETDGLDKYTEPST
jgi:hypothetical protein